MTTLILARHGETDWNRDGRYQGHADPPINARGREQALELAELLAGERVDAIYSSDLRRARDTAEIIATRLGVPVVVEPELREIDVGSWQGLRHADLVGREWDGEARDAHRKRIVEALRRIAGDQPGHRVLVVTHGGCFRRVFETLGDPDRPAAGSCEIFRLEAAQLD